MHIPIIMHYNAVYKPNDFNNVKYYMLLTAVQYFTMTPKGR